MTDSSSTTSNTDEAMINSLDEKERALFDMAVRVAINDERFPTNDNIVREMRLPKGLLPILARRGFLRIILYKGQLRQVEICCGPATGKKSKEPPGRLKKIRTIDKYTLASPCNPLNKRRGYS